MSWELFGCHFVDDAAFDAKNSDSSTDWQSLERGWWKNELMKISHLIKKTMVLNRCITSPFPQWRSYEDMQDLGQLFPKFDVLLHKIPVHRSQGDDYDPLVYEFHLLRKNLMVSYLKQNIFIKVQVAYYRISSWTTNLELDNSLFDNLSTIFRSIFEIIGNSSHRRWYIWRHRRIQSFGQAYFTCRNLYSNEF